MATITEQEKPHSVQPSSSDADARTTLNSLPHPVLRINADNQIRYANMAAEHFFRFSAAIMCRHTLDEIVPFGSPLLALVDQVRKRIAPISEYGVDLGTPQNGNYHPVDLKVSPVLESPGDILVMLQERTVAQQMDRHLMFQGAARSVTGLGAMLAHEVRNPLSGIRGAAQLLESVVDDDDQSLTRLIQEEVDRICRLVDRMEAFGDDQSRKREKINIHKVLDHVKRLAKSGFARHIRFIDEFDPSLPPVLADRDQLVQVFLNLVKNAAESIGRDAVDGRITLRTSFRPGIRLSVPGANEKVTLPLEFSVIDNGAGIPDDLMPHLFDPFISTKASGSGLGLALVAKIVRDHGGVIECESGSHRTRFRVLMSRYTETGGEA
jgi:two-component system, NtrC family, nitrogen regulation sensor histidine kinase GlnL